MQVSNPGVLSNDLLYEITDLVMEKGNLRFGLDLLKGLGYEAEHENKSCIDKDLLRKFIKRLRKLDQV